VDRARSDHPAVQAQLDRLAKLSPGRDILGLERVSALLERLGNPQRSLPPVLHVAGTNGKGSTCAFLRAAIEAAGLRTHVYSSPHLVRFNERIRLAGRLIGDEPLAALLAETLDAAGDMEISFFEATTAAAFLAFVRTPADACIVEVGLGGRLDATNVIERPAVCGIASLSIDHEAFLLAPEEGTPREPMARIAFEKAGIAKPGVPLVTHYYFEPEANWAIEEVADAVGAPLHRPVGHERWLIKRTAKGQLSYIDEQGYAGRPKRHLLPAPRLPGEHQVENAGLAIAMLRHQTIVEVPMDAIAKGIEAASWPARLQRLAPGPLTGAREVWLDGGHNASAGHALRRQFAGRRLHLVIGMLANKNPAALTWPMGDILASVTAVPVPAHEHHPPAAFGADVAGARDVCAALSGLPDDGLPVLIAGSLYLAGEVLKANDQVPD
jgi:dihydrofolate synthase/folylpolyglutamate synthase